MAEKTVVDHAIGKSAVGYMLNTLPSPENRAKVAALQVRLMAE